MFEGSKAATGRQERGTNSLLPNVFLAGSQKSGTTSLARYLESHPDCLLTDPKEPCVLSRERNLGRLEIYDRYLPAGERAGARFLIDASASYMCEPYAARRIFEAVGGGARLIFILRNPVERALSAYWHLYKRFDEQRDLASVFGGLSDNLRQAAAEESQVVEAALRARRIRVGRYRNRYDDFLWPFRYVGNSIYSGLLQPYLSLFPRGNLHIAFTEDLQQDPHAVYEHVQRFLGVDFTPLPGSIGRVFNRTIVPRPGTSRMVHGMMAWPPLRLLRDKAPWLDDLYQRRFFIPKPPVPEVHKARLAELFREETLAMSEIAGRDLSELGWPK